MHESPLTPWVNYYVIIGSGAAALTGLMFVVVTLIAGTRARRANDGIAAFNTPSVVHFCAALAVAAILTAPWSVLWHAALLLGLTGLWGLGYSAVVLRRMRRQGSYLPVLEDWAWHVVLPLVSYVTFAVAAPLLPGRPAETLFVVGAAAVLLLFIGIHNAWDNVTYLVAYASRPGDDADESLPVGEIGGAQPPASGDGSGAPTTTVSSPDAPREPEISAVGDAPRGASP